MANLADEIAKLCDPTPSFLDPEDDVNIETTARVNERFDEGSVIQNEVSSLRQRTVPLLEDVDSRYIGKRISRKSFDQSYEAGNESSSGSEESEDYSKKDGELNIFKQQILVNTNKQDSFSEEPSSYRSSEAESCSNESEEESHNNDSGEKLDADSDEEEQETEEDMFQKFSHIDVNEEIEKGRAVQAQQGLWNKFCECRIRFQKILTATNRLPQFDTWDDFKKKGDSNYSDALEKGTAGLKSFLDSMLELQSRLLLNNPETKSFVTQVDSPPAPENDEEISSGSESESEKTVVKRKKYPSDGEIKKRKRKLDEYGDILAKRFKTFVPYRNFVIQKWDDKTRLTTGRITHKSFNAFNQSAVKQIDQILQDKQRLIRRTQLKRSVYSVLGKNEENETSMCLSEENNEGEGRVKRDEHLNWYDPEIFDDDDFYRLLLKDIIESKTVGMDDDLLRTHKDLQKKRRRMIKKIDTKASKGRKLRYDPHPKMISFMAGVNVPYSEGTKDDLFKRLFNQSPAILACK